MLLSALISTGSSWAQAPPSVLLSEPEVVLHESELYFDKQSWEWSGRTGVAWRVRLPLDSEIRIIPAETTRPFTQFVPQTPGPWALINGGFYDEELRALGLVVSDGVVHTPLGLGGGSGIFQVGPDGPNIIHRDDWREPRHRADRECLAG